jgi:putative spermidine/putrescine transport system substrate-binding protein
MLTRRPTRRLAAPHAAIAIIALVASACGGSVTPPPTSSPSAEVLPSATASIGAPSGSPDPASALIDAAKAEGGLTVIGLPHDWCNYGELINTFNAKYDVPVTELNPDASQGDQVAAISGDAGKDPKAPDVIDVDLTFATQAKAAKLLQAYKVASWDDVPATARDPDGFWAGDYFGVLAFESNATVVTNAPEDWSNLFDPSHKGQVALAGDPRVNDQASQTVYASALSQPKGSLDNAQPGLDFFKQLNAAGHLLPTIAKPDTIDGGTTPLTIRWTWNALSHRDATNGSPEIEVTIPATGRLGSFFAQAISANAPHPNAAKLWLEFLASDEGQNLRLKGYCYPIRFDAMQGRDAIPTDLLANVPDPTGTVFPSLAQLDKASALITAKWDSVVGVDIK